MGRVVPGSYREPHRPQLHFSPRLNWLNDPNGLVYYEGVFHLFYQHNPHDKVWGSMSWGHAVSEDLFHWEHKPVALLPDPDRLGYVFSGCAVVDWDNTSGLGEQDKPPLIAIFTHSSNMDEQVQSLAYSNNAGGTWQMFPGNPVLTDPSIKDFRDPKVFWYEANECWIMVLAASNHVKFYRSQDLITWQHFYDFGVDIGVQGGVWECPDLFPLVCNKSKQEKWVLIVSTNPGGPNTGSGTQYFIGEFDGEEFHRDHTEHLWLDYGPDNYAGVTWSDISSRDGRRIMVGWMNNWQYANEPPTAPWKGALTIPRELFLHESYWGLRLGARPVRELDTLRINTVKDYVDERVAEQLDVSEAGELPELYDLEVSAEALGDGPDNWCLNLESEKFERLRITISLSERQIKVDRSEAAFRMNNARGFVSELSAPLDLKAHSAVGLRIIKDAASIEIFSDCGLSLLTVTYFVERPLNRLQLSVDSVGSDLLLRRLTVHELKSVWQQEQ